MYVYLCMIVLAYLTLICTFEFFKINAVLISNKKYNVLTISKYIPKSTV